MLAGDVKYVFLTDVDRLVKLLHILLPKCYISNLKIFVVHAPMGCECRPKAIPPSWWWNGLWKDQNWHLATDQRQLLGFGDWSLGRCSTMDLFNDCSVDRSKSGRETGSKPKLCWCKNWPIFKASLWHFLEVGLWCICVYYLSKLGTNWNWSPTREPSTKVGNI